MNKIYKIALTGGPGGGKSSSLECLKQRLEENNFKVFVVPEAATLMFNSGVDLRVISDNQLITLQMSIVQLIIALEDSFSEIAKTADKDCVIICDRGTMDSAAFAPPDVWQKVLEKGVWTNAQLKSRYDAVIHLMSAASGAEEAYTTENNKARTETPEQARAVDQLLHNVWTGHPHLRVIQSCTEFSDKFRNVLESVYRVVGIPEPIEIERKFLLLEPEKINIPVKYVDSVIEQIYLKDGSRIRSRAFDNYIQHTHTKKQDIDSLTRKEVEVSVSEVEYNDLLKEADLSRQKIKKIRRCFLWESQYFELDIFIDPILKFNYLLEIELNNKNQEVKIPEFLGLYKEVTGDPMFSNKNIALKTNKSALMHDFV